MRALALFFFLLILVSGQSTVQGQQRQSARLMIEKIVQHWRQNPSFYTTYNLREILHYLGRRYLQFSPEELNEVLDIVPLYDDDRALYPYYQKLHNRHFYPVLPLSHPSAPTRNGIERLMLAALYPDSVDFCAFLNEAERDTLGLSPEGFVRHMAHVALTVPWILSFHADTPACLNYRRLSAYRNGLLICLESLPEGSDSWMEGILALYWLGTPATLLPDVISVLEKAQCPGGAFRWDPNTDNCAATHEHPTLLALWILCLKEAGGRIESWLWPDE